MIRRLTIALTFALALSFGMPASLCAAVCAADAGASEQSSAPVSCHESGEAKASEAVSADATADFGSCLLGGAGAGSTCLNCSEAGDVPALRMVSIETFEFDSALIPVLSALAEGTLQDRSLARSSTPPRYLRNRDPSPYRAANAPLLI